MQNRKPVLCDSCRRQGLEGLGHFKSMRALLDFTPVPRRNLRHDGWTPARQRAFIAALAESGSVSLAAKAVNMAPEGAYMLRRQPAAESFAEAWDKALDHGAEIIDANAIERATNGVAVPIFHKGEQVGERRVYNERLTMWMLQHRKPKKYGRAHRGDIDPEEAEHLEAMREEAIANHSDWLDKIGRMHRARLHQERRERLAGNIAAADYYLRQLTHMEIMLELGGGGKHLRWMVDTGSTPRGQPLRDDEATRARLYRPGEPVWQTEVSVMLDQQRREVWAELGDPMRPPLPWSWGQPPNHMRGGPDLREREGKLINARMKAREAQRLWEEAAREEWEARTGETWKDLPDIWGEAPEAKDPEA